MQLNTAETTQPLSTRRQALVADLISSMLSELEASASDIFNLAPDAYRSLFRQLTELRDTEITTTVELLNAWLELDSCVGSLYDDMQRNVDKFAEPYAPGHATEVLELLVAGNNLETLRQDAKMTMAVVTWLRASADYIRSFA